MCWCKQTAPGSGVVTSRGKRHQQVTSTDNEFSFHPSPNNRLISAALVTHRGLRDVKSALKARACKSNRTVSFTRDLWKLVATRLVWLTKLHNAHTNMQPLICPNNTKKRSDELHGRNGTALLPSCMAEP